jgi:hypothetical protein
MALTTGVAAYAPYFGALVGSGSLIAGVHSISSPWAGLRLYGAPSEPPETSKSKDREPTTDVSNLLALTTTIALAQNSRNVAFGLSLITLAVAYHFEDQPMAASGIRRAMGVFVTVGTIIPLSDAFATRRYAERASLNAADRDTAFRASVLHLSRACIWLGSGLSCLLS